MRANAGFSHSTVMSSCYNVLDIISVAKQSMQQRMGVHCNIAVFNAASCALHALHKVKRKYVHTLW